MDSFSTYLTESDRVACGECFPYAYRLFKELSEKGEKDVALVHGMVTNPVTKDTFWHAWVNWNGDVYDWQSGGERSSYVEFKELWNPDIKDFYLHDDLDSVMLNMARKRHYGPWVSDE